MTYGDLLQSLARMALRTDLTADWPAFVRRAHDIIVDQVALVSPVTITGGTAPLPNDCSTVLAVWVDGTPRAWSVDGTLNVAVDRAKDHTGYILHRPAKAFFASEGATNTVLTNNPWTYEYGALSEAFKFMRDLEGQATNEGAFRGEMARITRSNTNAAAERRTPRISQPSQ